jgi:heme/copper-type cytochrome/quinol oxidase subunit 2
MRAQLWVVALVVLVGGMLAGCGGLQRRDEQASVTQAKPEEPLPPTKTEKELSGTVEGGVRVVHMTAQNWVFEPDEVVVKEGEPVKLVIENMDEAAYGFSAQDLGIEAKLPPKQQTVIEFTPEKMGDFVFRSTVGPKAAAGSSGEAEEMSGHLLVISPQS